MDHCPHELVQHFGGFLFVVGADFELVAEGDLPVELYDASAGLIVDEASEVDGQEVGEGLDEGAFLGFDEGVAGVALELVAACHLLHLAVVADGVVEGDIRLRQHQAQVHFFLLPLGDRVAGEAGGPGDSLREELFLQWGRGLALALDLVVDLVHEPDVELVAVLVPLPLEHR